MLKEMICVLHQCWVVVNMSVFQRKNVNSKDELQNIDGNDVWKNVKNDNDKMTLNAEDELQNIDGNVRENVKNNDDCMQLKSK